MKFINLAGRSCNVKTPDPMVNITPIEKNFKSDNSIDF